MSDEINRGNLRRFLLIWMFNSCLPGHMSPTTHDNCRKLEAIHKLFVNSMIWQPFPCYCLFIASTYKHSRRAQKMVVWNKLNKNQSGQAALEAAIILIAFVVVASVFAFAILSAGQSSTQKGEQAIYSGLANVQSSMEVKGAVIAKGNSGSTAVQYVVFTVAPVSGGNPVKLISVDTSSSTPT